MNTPLTCKTADHSDLRQFSFSFFCDSCGSPWRSPAISFKSGGFAEIEHEVTKKLIWEKEHSAAFTGSNLEAHFMFNYCKKCGRWVCDKCFDSEGQHEGICKKCS